MSFIDPKRIVLGCGNFGGIGSLPELIGKGESPLEARALLEKALHVGITSFDTANTYGGGQSELILGELLQRLSARERSGLQISTKVGNAFGCPSGDRPLSRRQIRLHLETSLRRLGIERISVYYLHEPDPATPLEETLEALLEAIQIGDIASFGLSNADTDYVTRTLEAAGPSAAGKLTHVQNEFHFLHRADERELIPFLAANGIQYVAFVPLAGGLLTGKYLAPSQALHGSRLADRPEPYRRFLNAESQRKIEGFVASAKNAGQSPVDRAIRFVLDTPGIRSVIIGPRKAEHIESLLA